MGRCREPLLSPAQARIRAVIKALCRQLRVDMAEGVWVTWVDCGLREFGLWPLQPLHASPFELQPRGVGGPEMGVFSLMAPHPWCPSSTPQKESQKADEYLREIQELGQLTQAVQQCIEAAGHEHRPDMQKSLLRVGLASGDGAGGVLGVLEGVCPSGKGRAAGMITPLALWLFSGGLLWKVFPRQISTGQLRAHVSGPACAQCHPGLPHRDPPHLQPVSLSELLGCLQPVVGRGGEGAKHTASQSLDP